MLFAHGLVDRTPVHGRLGARLADDVLVFGRAAGELSGADNKATATGQHPLMTLDGLFNELSGTEVPIRRLDIS